ncbi:hypothetical protein P152DRAFT_505025 [Eremomyces bilateralis CBS 781.70]|uniref:C2 NT-type domain-containing protein n=1 Tax=Eremomyces bilateralis CBS 781.70 TaxID=1392243 RepID=A0A6G1GEM2_9PEZI|nr:uncharacterized protein P152DRAFT_505025 [Eremomyces bilateralis CBS 781.70]KAF1816351.1 hypothetical protein P152DRAFT_505025 [Eremomyces bilateralis CBS 781.70]
MQAFVPKNRRAKFDLDLQVLDLNNVPLVSGKSFVKWHLPHSAAGDHQGRTEKRDIKEHKVTWNHEAHFAVRFTIDKSGLLQESWIHFEVIQEYSSGSKGERIILGVVKLNLAEYVEASEAEGDVGISRRYLMQDSKINSTLRISIFLRQTEGDRNFIAPPLRTAQVFGGIAGIVVGGEQVESDDIGQMPALSHRSREAGELQDLYRRTLAAKWAAQPGELSADKCIEDIFAGGDGWGDRDLSFDPNGAGNGNVEDSGSLSGSERNTLHPSRRNYSGAFSSRPNSKDGSLETLKDLDKHEVPLTAGEGIRGRGSLEQQAQNMKAASERGRRPHNTEMDEFDAREDLRSWQISNPRGS